MTDPSTPSRTLYIGPNIDLIPMLMIPDCKTWYCIECLPKFNPCRMFNVQPKDFLNLLLATYKEAGFDLESHTQNRLQFHKRSTVQTVIYFYSVLFDPDEPLPDYVRKEIQLCDSVKAERNLCKSMFYYLTDKFNLIVANDVPVRHDYYEDKNPEFMFNDLNSSYMSKRLKKIYVLDYVDDLDGYDYISELLDEDPARIIAQVEDKMKRGDAVKIKSSKFSFTMNLDDDE